MGGIHTNSEYMTSITSNFLLTKKAVMVKHSPFRSSLRVQHHWRVRARYMNSGACCSACAKYRVRPALKVAA